MTQLIDLTGKQFGRLTVLGIGQSPQIYWKCRCECGEEKVVTGDKLRSGWTQSCGCLQRDRQSEVGKKNRRHGYASHTRIYKIWQGMKERCFNTKHNSYPDYGGRGITVCERWMAFTHFLADMGEPPQGTSLDRIDVDGPYCKENCRWATASEQQRNKRNANKLTFDGKTQSIWDWVEELGLDYELVRARLRLGWSIDDALTVTFEEAKQQRIVKESRFVEYQGVTRSLNEWAALAGLRKDTLAWRMRTGWSLEKAMTTPARFKRKSITLTDMV
jgi:hypothetical protein